MKLRFGPKINVLLLDTRVLMKFKKSNFSYKELLLVGKGIANYCIFSFSAKYWAYKYLLNDFGIWIMLRHCQSVGKNHQK